MIGQFKDKIHFCSGMTVAEKRMAVEFARILGFQSEAAVFPVTDHNKGLAIPKALRELERFCPKVPEVLIVRGKVILQSQGKEFFTWHGKDFFT